LTSQLENSQLKQTRCSHEAAAAKGAAPEGGSSKEKVDKKIEIFNEDH